MYMVQGMNDSTGIPKGFMAGHKFVSLPTYTALLNHGAADRGTRAVVASLRTPVPCTRQQFVACGTTGRSFLITCQPLILHLSHALQVVI